MNAYANTFETSPVRSFGEVSNAALRSLAPKIPQIVANGTVLAIKYPTIGVAPDLPRGSSRGGARNYAERESLALSAAQVANLLAAARHADAIGLPFNRMITIHWQAAGQPLMGMAKATGRYLDLLTKWLSRQGRRTAWLWVHENGHGKKADGKGGHCHILVHVPAALVKRLAALQRGWLRSITGIPYRAGVILSRPIGGRLGLEIGNPELHASNVAAALGYVLKGASQDVLEAHGIERAHKRGGLVIGKRCGWSQNIGAKARTDDGETT